MTLKNRVREWAFRNRRVSFEVRARLEAVWEANLDPISDDYTPNEISAEELFWKWAEEVRDQHPDGLIPISWFVDAEGDDYKTFEFMPFQYEHYSRSKEETFLTFLSWPVNPDTGDELNWLELPVRDKLWNSTRADKGGFVQEATGWKPSILQPYVYLPALERAVRP